MLITVETEAGPVRLQHQDRRLVLLDSDLGAQVWWWGFLQGPAFGIDGHLLVPTDCSLHDVLEALGDRLDPEQLKRIRKAAGSLPELPPGALP